MVCMCASIYLNSVYNGKYILTLFWNRNGFKWICIDSYSKSKFFFLWSHLHSKCSIQFRWLLVDSQSINVYEKVVSMQEVAAAATDLPFQTCAENGTLGISCVNLLWACQLMWQPKTLNHRLNQNVWHLFKRCAPNYLKTFPLWLALYTPTLTHTHTHS